MYKRNAQGWSKHFDFMVVDEISLQLAFVLAALIRNRVWAYSSPLYRTMAFTLVISATLFGVTGVLCYELNRGGRVKIGRVLLNTIKNPIIIGGVLALIVRVSGLQLPHVILKPIEYFKSMCTPLGFLVLGGLLSFKSLKEDWKLVTVVSAVKLIVFPVAFCTLAYFVGGFRGAELASIFIVFSAPTAMSCMPMASELGGDVKLSGELIAVTTVLSLLTVFLYLTFFGRYLTP